MVKVAASILLFSVCLLLEGCTQESGQDWYKESVKHGNERDQYIEAQVDAGLAPEEARQLHDRRVWEMNTINMSREGDGFDQ